MNHNKRSVSHCTPPPPPRSIHPPPPFQSCLLRSAPRRTHLSRSSCVSGSPHRPRLYDRAPGASTTARGHGQYDTDLGDSLSTLLPSPAGRSRDTGPGTTAGVAAGNRKRPTRRRGGGRGGARSRMDTNWSCDAIPIAPRVKMQWLSCLAHCHLSGLRKTASLNKARRRNVLTRRGGGGRIQVPT